MLVLPVVVLYGSHVVCECMDSGARREVHHPLDSALLQFVLQLLQHMQDRANPCVALVLVLQHADTQANEIVMTLLNLGGPNEQVSEGTDNHVADGCIQSIGHILSRAHTVAHQLHHGAKHGK